MVVVLEVVGSSLLSQPSRDLDMSLDCAVLMTQVERIDAYGAGSCSDNNVCCLRPESDRLAFRWITMKGYREHGDRHHGDLLFCDKGMYLA